MIDLWNVWWVWLVGGVALGILEVFAPGFIFLGFAAGAVLTGLVLAVFPGLGLAAVCLLFACLSLLAWLGLRRAVGVRQGQIKLIDRDINEN